MPTNGLNEKVGLDVIGPLPPTERGHRYILDMVDCVTKALEEAHEEPIHRNCSPGLY